MGDDEIAIQTPQFEREDGISPDRPPETVEGFRALRELSDDELTALGLRPWDGELWLFPWEWRDAIPDGLEVESISGDRETFGDVEAVDNRFGVLAYGIRAGDGDG